MARGRGYGLVVAVQGRFGPSGQAAGGDEHEGGSAESGCHVGILCMAGYVRVSGAEHTAVRRSPACLAGRFARTVSGARQYLCYAAPA